MPKIDIAVVPVATGTGYPSKFDAACARRLRERLGNAEGLTDFEVNLTRLPPGAAFLKDTGNDHHLINRSDKVAVYLKVGSRHADDVTTFPMLIS